MILRVVTLLAVLALVSACTSVPQTSQEGLTRASEYNAELGAQYLNAGDLKRSRQKLQKALEQDADNAKANFFYGLLLSRLKQGGEAIGLTPTHQPWVADWFRGSQTFVRQIRR